MKTCVSDGSEDISFDYFSCLKLGSVSWWTQTHQRAVVSLDGRPKRVNNPLLLRKEKIAGSCLVVLSWFTTMATTMNTPLLPTPDFQGSMDRPSVTTVIPLSRLRDSPQHLIDTIKDICSKTKTNIYTEEEGFPRRVKYTITGQWRNCLQAARLLWYCLTKETTAYVNGEWHKVLDKPCKDVNGKTVGTLYPVSWKMPSERRDSLNILEVSGHFWHVLKARRELIARSVEVPKKTFKRRDSAKVTTSYHENQTIEIVHQFTRDFLEMSSVEDIRELPFKPDDFLRLLIGPGEVPERQVNIETESQK